MNKTPRQANAPEQSRVARRRARVRADLLAAARQVFARRGYQDATITEITQLADVAMGMFYLHFRDKSVPGRARTLFKHTYCLPRRVWLNSCSRHSRRPKTRGNLPPTILCCLRVSS